MSPARSRHRSGVCTRRRSLERELPCGQYLADSLRSAAEKLRAKAVETERTVAPASARQPREQAEQLEGRAERTALRVDIIGAEIRRG